MKYRGGYFVLFTGIDESTITLWRWVCRKYSIDKYIDIEVVLWTNSMPQRNRKSLPALRIKNKYPHAPSDDTIVPHSYLFLLIRFKTVLILLTFFLIFIDLLLFLYMLRPLLTLRILIIIFFWCYVLTARFLVCFTTSIKLIELINCSIKKQLHVK